MEFKMEEQCQSCETTVSGLDQHEVAMEFKMEERCQSLIAGSCQKTAEKQGQAASEGELVGESQWSSRWRSDVSEKAIRIVKCLVDGRNGVQDGGSDASRYVRRPLPGSLCVAMEFKMDERCQRG